MSMDSDSVSHIRLLQKSETLLKKQQAYYQSYFGNSEA